MLADRQTHTHRHTRPDRQTDTDITILRTPMGAAKNYIKTDETIEVSFVVWIRVGSAY